jgi:replication-associated recombination protein RarA
MNINDTVSTDAVSRKDAMSAAKDLADELRNEYKKLGYSLSYGYTFDDKKNTVISMTAQYTSWKRLCYKFGSEKTQAKARALAPKTREYEGNIIPVEFSVASVGKFL